jgi:adenine-specific DNA-methyltransferase
MSTKPGDIVLDFFAGSGTSGAVAHKMGRQWIMIEQMDYIETITKLRMQKVIEGEAGGVSKALNWSGGGSFVYLELAKYNQIFVEKITNAQDVNTLEKIWQDMKDKSLLDYKLNMQQLDKYFKNPETLSLIDAKQILIDVLNKNMLYIPLEFRDFADDYNMEITGTDMDFTKQFYDIKK